MEKMIALASDILSEHGVDEYHTVAGVVATPEGKLYGGLNLHHFTGGIDGEIVALTQAISNGEKEISIVVAVGDRGRGVLTPCGKCRQILFDYFPDVQVVVNREGVNATVPITELLPDSYKWMEQ